MAPTSPAPTDRRPRIVVVNATGERWPGLEVLDTLADVTQAHDVRSLALHARLADVLVVTDFRTRVLAELVPGASNLRWIHATSAGLDSILIPEVLARAPVVTSARGVFDQSIAEYVVGVILAFAKDLRRTFELMGEARWLHRETQRVADQRALIVGCGAIGRTIARACRGVGLTVEGIDRQARDGDADLVAIHAVDELHDRLPHADYVVIAAPLTFETRGMIDRSALARMKPSARLINIGRGPIVDTGALIAALRERRLAGAALDVVDPEPLPPDSPLWAMDNVIVTAHQCGDFFGWKQALSDQFVSLFRTYLAGGQLPDELARLAPPSPGAKR